MERPGVALLGLDHWYAAFDLVRQAAESQHVRLVAVAHDDAAKAEQVAQRYGAEVATTDYRAALDRPDVRIVVALYSADRHAAIAREAAALGKHIVGVKPMALTLEAADTIVAAVQAAHVHYFSLDCLGRLNAETRRVRQWVDDGRIGRLLRFTHTLNGSLPQAWPDSDDTGWWTDPACVPGGAWIDHAIYAVDTARWLFGDEPAAVSGYVANLRHTDLALEDYGMATFSFAGGVASVEDTWTADRGYGFSRSELIGTHGAICLDAGVSGKVALRGDFGYDGWVSLEPARGGGGVLDHVAAVVRGEVAPVATVVDGRANLAACLAFYEAAQRIG